MARTYSELFPRQVYADDDPIQRYRHAQYYIFEVGPGFYDYLSHHAKGIAIAENRDIKITQTHGHRHFRRYVEFFPDFVSVSKNTNQNPYLYHQGSYYYAEGFEDKRVFLEESGPIVSDDIFDISTTVEVSPGYDVTVYYDIRFSPVGFFGGSAWLGDEESWVRIPDERVRKYLCTSLEERGYECVIEGDEMVIRGFEDGDDARYTVYEILTDLISADDIEKRLRDDYNLDVFVDYIEDDGDPRAAGVNAYKDIDDEKLGDILSEYARRRFL